MTLRGAHERLASAGSLPANRSAGRGMRRGDGAAARLRRADSRGRRRGAALPGHRGAPAGVRAVLGGLRRAAGGGTRPGWLTTWPATTRAANRGYGETSVTDYPKMITPADHVEPVPRRIRAMLGGEVVLDTTEALYVWEWPNYPQYYIPVTDVKPAVLVDEQHPQKLRRGTARRHGLRAGGISRPGSARVYGSDALAGLAGTVRFDWDALDAWFEEEEEVFVHPRNPYTRVDALRSARTVRVELDGITLAESSSPVMVFETGLPTRYYLNRTEVNFAHLQPTATVTSCPYKGKTSGYWSVRAGEADHLALAWPYAFPPRQLLPIAGMVAFYNEKVDITIDGRQLERPVTHFFR